ncbi:hypothetical protein SAMN05446037_10121 [Anaerovirgula multivorans]|uniref:Uncharacterized protein n=1 Tax=Anaerovirgula multivorans TaxID=312168 RepID=A0A239F5E3_9FIRM|nr:hypothetical protein [Anaerovirgula multivorans]SNS51728.1 hypothetical protein SAMN05446037_10121 [Anaerovirgula multivorans]
MQKSQILLLAILTFLLSSTINVFAVTQSQWKYSKEVYFENKEDVKAIYLDDEIYRHAKEDLSDLRLINEKSEFIPYYIYNRFLSTNKVEYTEYIGKEVLSFMKDNDYYIDYEINSIKENMDVIGNKLNFNILKDSFYKEVQIFGSHDNKSWENIKSDIIYRVNDIEKLAISLDDTYKYLYYRIVSVNDTSGVAINNMSLEYDVNEAIYEEYKGFKKIDHKVEVNKESNETILNIHNRDRLRINSIRIISKDDFNRSYKLYITNGEGEKLKEVRKGEIYRLNLNQVKAENTSIQIGCTTGEFITSEHLQVVIKDRDDYPINIEGVEISYYIDKMVFKSNDTDKIHILFGNEEISKPHYDISTYIEEIEKVKQESTSLSDLVEKVIEEKDQEKNFEFKWILNISVLLISGLLIILIIRKGHFHIK